MRVCFSAVLRFSKFLVFHYNSRVILGVKLGSYFLPLHTSFAFSRSTSRLSISVPPTNPRDLHSPQWRRLLVRLSDPSSCLLRSLALLRSFLMSLCGVSGKFFFYSLLSYLRANLLITAAVPDSFVFYFCMSVNFAVFLNFSFYVCVSRGLVSVLRLRKKHGDTCNNNCDDCCMSCSAVLYFGILILLSLFILVLVVVLIF